LQYQTVKGEEVPSLGLGTWRLSGRECRRSVRRALELGYRHVDTARMYRNEREVGEGMRDSGVPRGEVFLVTKVWPSDFRHDAVLRAARDSLGQLGTEYVDLLLMHWPNPDVPLGETLGAMRELQEAGGVRHIGVSNFSPALVEEARGYAEIFCNQVEYNPFNGQKALVRQARELDYLLTAYSPVARGAVNKDATLREIGERHGKTPGQVALRWLVQQEKVAAIPKAASEENLKGNLDIFDFQLSDEEMDHIFALSR
jgi:diketogulonate reductase-like aldo/keto reductase